MTRFTLLLKDAYVPTGTETLTGGRVTSADNSFNLTAPDRAGGHSRLTYGSVTYTVPVVVNENIDEPTVTLVM